MLKRIHYFVYERTRLSFAIGMCVMLLCAVLSLKSNFNESVSDILPVRDQLIEEHERALKYFGQDKTLYFSISAKDVEALPALSEKFAQSLRSIESLDKEFHGAGGADLAAAIEAAVFYAPHIFDEEDISALEMELSPEAIDSRFAYLKNEIVKFGAQPYVDILAKDPFGIMAVYKKKLEKLGGMDLSKQSSAIISADGTSALIIASFNVDSRDSAASSMLVEKVSKIISDFLKENPYAEIAFAGAYRISADNAKMARSDSEFCLKISIALMLALCLLAFKRKVYALFSMLPSMLGTFFVFSVIGIAFDSVSAISIGFASIAIGVTMDYSIHILFHTNAESAKGIKMFSDAAQTLARPTIIGSATTAIAFVIMMFSGSRGFSHLGLFGAGGVAVSAFLSLAIIPPLAAKLEYKKFEPSVFDTFADKIRAIKKHSSFYVLAILFTIISAAFIKNLEFDGRISSFNGLYKETKADSAKIRAIWSGAVSKSLALAYGKDLDAALEKNLELYENLLEETCVENLDSIVPFIAKKERREKNLKQWQKLFKDKAKLETDIFSAAKKYGFKTAAFQPALDSTEAIPFEDAFEKMRASPFGELFNSKIKTGEDGVYISTLMNIKPQADRAALRARIGGGTPEIILADNKLFESHASQLALNWMITFLIISLSFVSAYVLWAFKSFFKTALVMLPVMTGLFWTFGIMAIFGIPVTLINAIFVIFAVCIAEDYAVFIIFERLRGKPSGALQSVMVSALTTVVGFGALGLADHPVLKGLGVTAAISIFSILLASFMITFPLSKYLKAEHEQ